MAQGPLPELQQVLGPVDSGDGSCPKPATAQGEPKGAQEGGKSPLCQSRSGGTVLGGTRC